MNSSKKNLWFSTSLLLLALLLLTGVGIWKAFQADYLNTITRSQNTLVNAESSFTPVDEIGVISNINLSKSTAHGADTYYYTVKINDANYSLLSNTEKELSNGSVLYLSSTKLPKEYRKEMKIFCATGIKVTCFIGNIISY